jgi:ATP-binding cassette subfamily F protein uup
LREESKARRFQQGKVNMGVQDAQRSGKLVFDIEHLSVSYDNNLLIRDFSGGVTR